MFSPKATGHAISILISKFKTGGSFVLVFKKKKAIQWNKVGELVDTRSASGGNQKIQRNVMS